MTVIRPLAALVTGLCAGLLENSLENPDSGKERQQAPKPIPLRSLAQVGPQRLTSRLLAGMRYALVDVWGDIVGWFFVGLVLAGVITAYLPENMSEVVLGGGIVSMLTMLAVGMPVYICATASTPVAAALLLKGASPGAVLVFLLAGPATNMTSLSVLIQVLGKLGTIRYLLVVATVSVLFGLGLDTFYTLAGIEPRAAIGEVRDLAPHWLKLGGAGFLVALSCWHLARRFIQHRPGDTIHGTVCADQRQALATLHRGPGRQEKPPTRT